MFASGIRRVNTVPDLKYG